MMVIGQSSASQGNEATVVVIAEGVVVAIVVVRCVCVCECVCVCVSVCACVCVCLFNLCTHSDTTFTLFSLCVCVRAGGRVRMCMVMCAFVRVHMRAGACELCGRDRDFQQ